MLRIEAPQAQPEKGGLFAHVTPSTDVDNFAFTQGVSFESVLAGNPQPVPTTGEKEFGGIDQVEFDAFTVYSGIEASIVDDVPTTQARLKDAFEGNLSKAVESYIQENILNDGSNISATPVMNPRLALGLLEQWASENLGTLAMIHTNKLGASMLRDLKGDDGTLFTKQGNPVANGGGYGAVGPGGTEAAENQAWVYVSRVPTLYRSETLLNEGHILKENLYHVLAEAAFVPIIEGETAALLLEG